MALTSTETRNLERVRGLYRDVLDPHDRTRLAESCYPVHPAQPRPPMASAASAISSTG